MKYYSLIILLLISVISISYPVKASRETTNSLRNITIKKLSYYKEFLEKGTYEGLDWSYFPQKPKSRYNTFKAAFKYFEENCGKIVVELGTTRSFVHGGLPGCNSDDIKYWTPYNPENWDWGAGCFTRMAAECLHHLNPLIHTVDLAPKHIQRCKIITADFKDNLIYHVSSSVDFLKKYPKNEKIDLLYLDTGDITPIERTAQLHLEEARIIVDRNLVKQKGIILIDDVRHPATKQQWEKSDLGKAKYSIPFFLQHGFIILEDEFQVILQKL